MCIRYMPKVSFDKRVIHAGERSMQVNRIKAPKVAKSTLGVQNSHDHSTIGVSIITPGVPFHQKLHAVNAPPISRQSAPIRRRLLRFQSICTRM